MSEANDMGSGSASDPPVDRKAARPAAAPPLRRKRRLSPKARARKQGQIDLGALLSEPLHVLRDGKPCKMDPLEAAIRRQVQKVLVDKSMPAIKAVIDLAIEHGLIASQAPARKGGVVRIPYSIGREIFERIFKYRDMPIDEMLAILETHYGEA